MVKSERKTSHQKKKKKKTLFNDQTIMLWLVTLVFDPARTNPGTRCCICRKIFPSKYGLLDHISNCDSEIEGKGYDSDVEVLMDTSESEDDAAKDEVPVCRKKSSSLRFKLNFSVNDKHWKVVDTHHQQQQVSTISLLNCLPKLCLITGKRGKRGRGTTAYVNSNHTTKTMKKKTVLMRPMKTNNKKKNPCSASNKETGVVDNPPWMTLRMVETIKRIGVTKPVWLVEKELQESDTKRQQGRLFIPSSTCEKLEELMSDDEKEKVLVRKEKKVGGITVKQEKKGGIKVGVVWPMGEVVEFDFKKWESLEQYVLAKPWSEMVGDYRVKKDESVLLWSFRDRNRRLCFAVNIRRLGNNDVGTTLLEAEAAASNEVGSQILNGVGVTNH